MSNDAGKKSSINWLALSLLSMLIMIMAGVAFLYLPVLKQQTSADIVMIRAEDGPFKTKPTDPGGKIITNQESQVMRMLSDLTPKTEEVETLLPPLDAPELPPVAVELNSKPEALVSDNSDSKTTYNAGAETDSNKAAKSLPDNDKTTQSAERDVHVGAKVTGNSTLTELTAEKTGNNIAATPKPTKPTKASSKPITTLRVATDSNEPTYIVQLAAFRKENVAAEQAGLLLKKHEKRLQGATLGTIRINNGENGIFWRIVSEPLPREAADTICASLKRAGQDCILRKFTSPSQ